MVVPFCSRTLSWNLHVLCQVKTFFEGSNDVRPAEAALQQFMLVAVEGL